MDKESGKPKTYGFVTYQDSCSVQYACELFNGLKLFGCSISCRPQLTGDNSRNDNSRHNFQAGSPSQMNSSSDDEYAHLRRHNDIRRTPSLQLMSFNESPLGRTPNMNPIGSHPLLQRAISSDSILPSPLMGMRMQPLLSHSFQNSMGSRQLFDSSVISRRERYGHERRQLCASLDRRYRPKPY